MTEASLKIQNKILQRLKPPSPAGLRVFYIGGYWRQANDMVAQMLHGLRAAGANVFDFNTDDHLNALETDGLPYDRGTSGPVWLIREKVFPLIKSHHPHLVICNAGGISFRPLDADRLRSWGVKLIGIALSDPDVREKTTSKIFRNFDIFFSNDKQSVQMYSRSGVPSYQLPIATNDQFFHPVPSAPEYTCDVLHLGAAHQDRIEPVKELIKHFKTHVYGENWEKYDVPNRGYLYGEELLKALNSAKIVILFPRTPSGQKTIKVGIFDFLAAGALVITEDFPELRQYFDVNRELITYNNMEEMLEKINYYIDHPDEAAAVRKAGRDKVLSYYTWQQTWPKILAPVIQVKG